MSSARRLVKPRKSATFSVQSNSQCDGGAPELPGKPEIGAELAGVAELGSVAQLAELERLDDMRNRPANEPEVHMRGTLEANRLDRRRREPVRRRVVRSEHDVFPALEHLELRA